MLEGRETVIYLPPEKVPNMDISPPPYLVAITSNADQDQLDYGQDEDDLEEAEQEQELDQYQYQDQYQDQYQHEDQDQDHDQVQDQEQSQENCEKMDLETELKKFVGKGKMTKPRCGDEGNEKILPKKTRTQWTPDMTKALINCYSSLKETCKLKGEKFWSLLSKVMVEKGHDVSAHLCESKWDSLCRTYKNTIDRSKQTGTSPSKESKSTSFKEMHKFMYKRPEINPPAVASSLAGYKRKVSSIIDVNGNEIEISPKRLKRAKAKKPDAECSMTEMNDDANFRHKENLERKDALLDIMKDVRDSLIKRR
ncbi:uncharacterized protein LOC127278166 isoform X3 [Leptopilina boulardi]|uniref:uncharacterized protein LOC127278166 isoform X3 n=1 Tax=Leptopilina boulardi TaxID=63433 RepID=UPI0021F5C8F1|nr:uncharacterized protein LOC127278166 isoform X3 [Leptopilina boulardi]